MSSAAPNLRHLVGSLKVESRTVLIISDDADFARSVIGRWQSERNTPAFTQMSSDLGNGAGGAAYDLAIVGRVAGGELPAILGSLDSSVKPMIVVGSGAEVQAVRESYPRVLAIREHEDWADSLVVLGSEALRRVELADRVVRAEQVAAASLRHAALGQYMMDMRHSFNNALTSLLGNAELLLLEPGALSVQVRDQIDTMHTMAMRLHEIMQRFSSLDSEMQRSEKKSQSATSAVSAVFAARG
jgi:signal transduction histidine kinase